MYADPRGDGGLLGTAGTPRALPKRNRGAAAGFVLSTVLGQSYHERERFRIGTKV
jgi:hypothetical protein